MSGHRTDLVPAALIVTGPALALAAWLFLPADLAAARIALEALGAVLLGTGLVGLCRG